MTDYPGAVYSPRTKENKAGVVYDASKKTIGYVEDITKLDDEVVAVETELGTNPKGAKADVKTRLDDVDTAITGKMTNPMDAQGQIVFGGAGGTPTKLPVGVSGKVLVTKGAAANPEWGEGGVWSEKFSTAVNVTNTVVETDLLNFTVPGGTIGESGLLIGEVYIDNLDGLGRDDLQVKLYYGAASITFTIDMDVQPRTMKGYFQFRVMGTGATNTQKLVLTGIFFKDECVKAAFITKCSYAVDGAANIDSTLDKALRITVKWENADPESIIHAEYGYAFKI